MAVKNPLKVTITNYPEGKVEYLPASNNPENEELGLQEFNEFLRENNLTFIKMKSKSSRAYKKSSQQN